MKLLAIYILFSFFSLANASEEEFLNWSSVKIDLIPSSEAGESYFEAKVYKGNWKSFIFHAFGEKHVLSPSDLEKLKGFPLSSVSTTHEGGYEILGGYTLHLSFHKIYYTKKKELIRDEIYVSATKKGISVGEVRSKNLTEENKAQ